MLAMLVLLNPGDEVIVFDPYFVMYDALAAVVGAKVVYVDTYPDFRIDPGPRGRRHHAADEDDRLQQPRQSRPAPWPARTRSAGLAELAAGGTWSCSATRSIAISATTAVRLAGRVQSADAGGRRVQQDLRRCPAGGWGSPTGRRPSSAR